MTRTLLIDARCLQDPGYATRGIGRHLETMLAAAPAAVRQAFTLTGLVDPALPPLAGSARALFGRLTTTCYAASREPGAVFLNPAPLSFAPGQILRLLRAPLVVSIAVVLDFIPLDFPDLYLRDEPERRMYRRALAALRHYDRFLPISGATAARLDTLIAGSAARAVITGVALRAGLTPETDQDPLPFGTRHREIFVVSGDDHRKNPEITAVAHGSSVLMRQAGIALRFAGIHSAATRARLAATHAEAGGDPALLRFAPFLTEAGLARAYAEALLVIAPSRAEGFSLPIIEALAQATPVLAAEDPAQAELITDAADRFAPDDADALRTRMETLSLDPRLWRQAAARQEGVWRKFLLDAVAARFWQPCGQSNLPVPAIGRRARPRIALLSPLPPTASGVADHTQALLAALAPEAEVIAFSDTMSVALPDGIRFGGRADATIMRSQRFDAIIAAIGNGTLHRRETELLLRFGAAAIVHDARLIDLYRTGFGDARALGAAIAERAGPVTFPELDAWEADQTVMPVRFLGEVAAAASPLIVHSAATARYVGATYGIVARLLPFPPYRMLPAAMLTPDGRAAARRRLRIPPETPLIVSFGHIHLDKAPDLVILAAAALYRARRFRLALAGSANPRLVAELRALAEAAGLPPSALIIDADVVSEAVYRDYLAAADCAIQLRRAPPGSISGALMDAIAAGLPAVAAATLTEAIMPPSYVQTVADDAAPGDIALALGAALDQGSEAASPARDSFLAIRSMSRYASQLLRTVLD